MTPSFKPCWKFSPIDIPVTSSIQKRSSSSFCGSYFWAIWGENHKLKKKIKSQILKKNRSVLFSMSHIFVKFVSKWRTQVWTPTLWLFSFLQTNSYCIIWKDVWQQEHKLTALAPQQSKASGCESDSSWGKRSTVLTHESLSCVLIKHID